MQVQVDNGEFKPVKITFTCETQDELNRLATLLNYVPIIRWLNIEGKSSMKVLNGIPCECHNIEALMQALKCMSCPKDS